MLSRTSSSETTVPFLDDTSEEHKQFLNSSYKEILLSNKKNFKNKNFNNIQKKENQEKAALLKKTLFMPQIPPPALQSKLLCPVPKFKNCSNTQRLQLPSPVIEVVESIDPESAPISPNLLFKLKINDNLIPDYNNAATRCIQNTICDSSNQK